MATWLLVLLASVFAGGWIDSIRKGLRVTAVAQEALACARRHAARVFEVQAERIAEVADLKKQNLALAERVAQQSELLSRASEREQEAARRLGYLFPRGLEMPPSREDALSPTWCRGGRFKVGERVYVKDGEIWTPAAITGFEDGVYELAIDGCQFPARAMEPAIKTYEEFDRAVSEEAMAEKASKLFVAGPDRQYVELTDNQRNQVAIDNLRGKDALPR